MVDKLQLVLAKYELALTSTVKSRGALLAYTAAGEVYSLREYKGSKERAALQHKLQEKLFTNGLLLTDLIKCAPSGDLLITDEDTHTSYALKRYTKGRECDAADIADCINAVKLLARIAPFMNLPGEYVGFLPIVNPEAEYDKHNKELKRVRTHIREKSRKTEFELMFLTCFDRYYEKAKIALALCGGFRESLILKQITGDNLLSHGNFNYHNVIFCDKAMGLNSFDNISRDSYLGDLYHFLRKVLEKHHWSVSLGHDMLNAFDKQHSLTREDLSYLYMHFAYPFKFWKVANYYQNAGKSWIDGRFTQKLTKVLELEDNFDNFLGELLSVSK